MGKLEIDTGFQVTDRTPHLLLGQMHFTFCCDCNVLFFNMHCPKTYLTTECLHINMLYIIKQK